jgi:lysophospholipase L1-like esterase
MRRLVACALTVIASAAVLRAAAPVGYVKPVPEGNYAVTLTFGPAAGATDTTVKAEQRRLMLEHVRTGPGETVTRTMTVNVRTPVISTGGRVHLKSRETQTEQAEWDGNLSLEFLGGNAAVSDVQIALAPAGTPTVFIMGDSTVCDQPNEPWASWGQMLPRFFKPGIAVANYAESGESLRSSLGAHRLDKVLSVMKPGDYLLVQFGHNDMKEKGEGVGAFTTYKHDLKHFADAAKAKGATVVLITSMERKAGVNHDTLGDYPAAVRQLAAEEHLPLIDLHAMSKTLYRALGPDLPKAFQDGTHHNNYGAYELAKCVVQGIKDSHAGGLDRYVVDEFRSFDPAHPDPVAAVQIPASANSATTKPEGN